MPSAALREYSPIAHDPLKSVGESHGFQPREYVKEHNRNENAGSEYMDFLIKVYCAAYKDKNFAEELEVCLHYSVGFAPTIKEVECALARMDGGIRPLLVMKEIVEPLPEVEKE